MNTSYAGSQNVKDMLLYYHQISILMFFQIYLWVPCNCHVCLVSTALSVQVKTLSTQYLSRSNDFDMFRIFHVEILITTFLVITLLY